MFLAKTEIISGRSKHSEFAGTWGKPSCKKRDRARQLCNMDKAKLTKTNVTKTNDRSPDGQARPSDSLSHKARRYSR